MFKLKAINSKQSIEQKKALAEAGNAIADTLKVAFDNLKNQGFKIDKLNKKDTEYQSRFHKMENDIRRLMTENEKLMESRLTGEKKYERNSKTN